MLKLLQQRMVFLLLRLFKFSISQAIELKQHKTSVKFCCFFFFWFLYLIIINQHPYIELPCWR
jgi:hypothetical protein